MQTRKPPESQKRLTRQSKHPPQTDEVKTIPDRKRDPNLSVSADAGGQYSNTPSSPFPFEIANADKGMFLEPFYPTYTPVIDSEFASLFSEVDVDDNHDLLEAFILESKYVSPILVSQISKRVLDHHHVFQICLKHKIPYMVVEIDLPNRDAELRWMIRYQSLRRNLSPFARGKLVLDTLSENRTPNRYLKKGGDV